MAMNNLLNKFKKQIRSMTNTPLELHFCSHILTLMFYMNTKLDLSIKEQEYEIRPTFIAKLIDSLNETHEKIDIKWFDDLNVKEIEWLSLCLYLLDLYIVIFKLHMQLTPLNYFYERNYNLEQDKKSIALMEIILTKISLFNKECISLLKNQYSEVVKFAKLSWMDIEKYVK